MYASYYQFFIFFNQGLTIFFIHLTKLNSKGCVFTKNKSTKLKKNQTNVSIILQF